MAAFGFYDVDLGDGGGTLRLTFRNGGELVLDRIVPLAQGPEADGSVLFFGVRATNAADRFDQVQFNWTSQPGQGVDFFGFDNLTIAPEPAAAAEILAAACALLGARSRRRREPDPVSAPRRAAAGARAAATGRCSATRAGSS